MSRKGSATAAACQNRISFAKKAQDAVVKRAT